MTVLALDSTTPAGSVALGLADGTVVTRSGDPGLGWSERLPGDLLALLGAHGLRPVDVELFAVATGPGSLTGLRVGIATIQGLAFATGRRVAGVSALDALADHACQVARPDESTIIGAWTNAMRGEVFSALYAPRTECGPDEDPWVPIGTPAVDVPADASARWLGMLGDRRLIVAGDVDGTLGEPLKRAFGARAEFVARPWLAGVVIALARRQAARGETTSPHAVRPLYVRKPDAVLARERALAGGRGNRGPSTP